VEAIRLRLSERETAAQVLARAFFDYPMITYYWPDLGSRMHYLEWYWGCAINYGLRYGQVYAAPDIAGVSVWLPPGQTHITTWRYSLAGYLLLPLFMGFRQFFTKTIKSDDLAQRVHEEIMPGPHWYLWIVAVDPDQQGKGIGTTLMRPGTECADAQHLPCYLETYDRKNVPFYLRHGFALVRAEQVPGSDLCFWCFRREPR
jgi:GNAT superfamily N-acetyltransferase